MGLSIADAYAQIKTLENSGQITLPTTLDTVTVGTIDPKAGTFAWSVPTLTRTTVIPPIPPQKTNTIINQTVGVVATKAVDLRLRFAVIPIQTPLTNAPVMAMTAAPAGGRPGTGGAAAAATARTALKVNPVDIGVIGGLTNETNGGTTIAGFPTVTSVATEIIVDAGLICSQYLPEAISTTPRVSTVDVTISIPGKQDIAVPMFVLRPPVVGMGMFTIPALPMTIVYAPPQGKQLKNTATYADTETLTRTVTSAITQSTNTKTAQAYSPADLIGKVAGAITAVAAVVGTGGAGAAGGASVAGALSELGSALFGGAKDANDSTADATKQISSELSLVSNIITAVDGSGPPSSTGVLTVENDHSLTIATSTMSQYMSDAGLGSGPGDRIVYLSNVKAFWAAANGEVGISIIGSDGPAANAMQDLQQELQSLKAGNAPRLGLDAASIQSLLNQDPLTAAPARPIVSILHGPLIGPPRFTPADPPERKGSGTGPTGDQFQVTLDTTTEDKTVNTSSTTNVTDFKPGWAAVLFGADNTETTTTTTFTTSQTTDLKTEEKIVSTVTMFSQGADDAYDIKIFYDATFKTYAIVDANSPALQGVTVVKDPFPLQPVSTG